MKNKTTMTSKQLEAILKQHAIDKGYWPEMKALVFYGKRPGSALLRRLHNVGNYANCLGRDFDGVVQADLAETQVPSPRLATRLLQGKLIRRRDVSTYQFNQRSLRS